MDQEKEYNIDLDTHWVAEFNKIENEYNDFYEEMPKQVQVFNLYVDHNNALEFVTTEDILLTKKGEVEKQDFKKLIIKNKTPEKKQEKKYKLKNILKYNYTVKPEKLLKMMSTHKNSKNYLTEIETFEDLIFKKTIYFFNSVNAIYLLFTEEKKTNSNTRKIQLTKQASKKRRTRCKRT